MRQPIYDIETSVSQENWREKKEEKKNESKIIEVTPFEIQKLGSSSWETETNSPGDSEARKERKKTHLETVDYYLLNHSTT